MIEVNFGSESISILFLDLHPVTVCREQGLKKQPTD